MNTDPTGQPTEEELRAAYEAEIKKIRVEQMLLENVVTLVNLGMRRTGLAPGTEDERDQTQVRIAIEAVRALLPLVEQAAPSQAAAIRDAVSQLQLAYVRIGGQPSASDQPPEEQGGTPPAEGSGAEAPEGTGGSGTPGGTGGSGTPGGTGGSGTPPGEPAAEPTKPGEPGPAQRSGRLWVPGQ